MTTFQPARPRAFDYARPAMMRTFAVVIATIVAGACARPSPEPPADLVLTGGVIHAFDGARTRAEAVAMRQGRIVALGTDADVQRFVGPATRTVPLGGRLVLPAFHDAHVHPMSAGVELGQCNLNDLPSAAATLDAIRQCAAGNAGKPWLIGGGWLLTTFPPGQPRRQDLDAITGEVPAVFSSSDGHTVWVNSAALKAAGITRTTQDPPSGRIERDSRGEPTGLLREAATDLVSRVVPPTTTAEYQAGLVRALARLNQFGIVSFEEASAREPMVAAYRAVAREGRLTARAHLSLYADPALDASQVDRFVATRRAVTEPGLSANAVKIFVDGVIEAGTAAVIDPYLPLAGDAGVRPHGLPNFSDQGLAALVTRLDREGFQTHMHAIGDAGVRQGLDAIAAAASANGPRDRRPHIAHIQLIHPADIPRFSSLGVIANMQPFWASRDRFITDLTEPRLGPERSRWLYPFRALQQAGARLAGGSDWSVSSVNPLDAIEVAVTRKDVGAPDDAPAWLPEHRLDLETAIAAYTNGGAFVSFEDDSGSLAAGKLADLIVLDRNIFERPAREIHEARVLWTLLEGREVYRADNFRP